MYSPQLLAAFEELRQARPRRGGDHQHRATSSGHPRGRPSSPRGEKLRLFGLTDEQIADAEAGEASQERLTVYSPDRRDRDLHCGSRGRLRADWARRSRRSRTCRGCGSTWRRTNRSCRCCAGVSPSCSRSRRIPGKQFAGRISFIEPIVDERTRTAAVRVAVDNSDATAEARDVRDGDGQGTRGVRWRGHLRRAGRSLGRARCTRRSSRMDPASATSAAWTSCPRSRSASSAIPRWSKSRS